MPSKASTSAAMPSTARNRVAGVSDGKVHLWDRATGKLLREVTETDKKLRISFVRFLDNGKVLAAHVGGPR